MFPGKCVRCGGPQQWTLDQAGETWVRCEDESCLDAQFVLPLNSTEVEAPDWWDPGMELYRGQGVVPCEGGADETSRKRVECLEGSPQDFLNTLWEGADGQATRTQD